jgi:hypothetical protein
LFKPFCKDRSRAGRRARVAAAWAWRTAVGRRRPATKRDRRSGTSRATFEAGGKKAEPPSASHSAAESTEGQWVSERQKTEVCTRLKKAENTFRRRAEPRRVCTFPAAIVYVPLGGMKTGPQEDWWPVKMAQGRVLLHRLHPCRPGHLASLTLLARTSIDVPRGKPVDEPRSRTKVARTLEKVPLPAWFPG